MTALVQDGNFTKLGTEELPPPPLLALPVEANKQIFGGAAVCSNAAGNAVSAADAGALFCWGRCERGVNNLTTNAPYGAAGAQVVLVRPGVVYYNQDGSITQANVGQACFFVDDNTVSANAGGGSAVRPFAGMIVPPGSGQQGIALASNTQVPVYLGYPSPTGLVLKYNVPFTLAQLQALTSGTAFNVGVPLPPNARLEQAEINVTTALSGGGATAVTMTLQGGSDAAGSIIASTSVFTGGPAVIATPGSNPYAARGGQQIKATITNTGGTMATLTAGALSVDLFYAIVP